MGDQRRRKVCADGIPEAVGLLGEAWRVAVLTSTSPWSRVFLLRTNLYCCHGQIVPLAWILRSVRRVLRLSLALDPLQETLSEARY